MNTDTIRFDDADNYERYMGDWSRQAGEQFLDWLAPPPGLAWLDVGCGSGAFSSLLAGRCAPAALQGIDPSPAQIGYARTHLAAIGQFQVGDAMALPFADRSFDMAAMALVIFFVPDPLRSVQEMRRVTRPGGQIGAYAWDMLAGGFPYAAVQDALRDIGIEPPMPPSVAVSRRDALQALWESAGLLAVESRVIEVTRQFDDFDSFWHIVRGGPATSASIAGLSDAQKRELQQRTRERLALDGQGRISITARAHAVKGCVPD